MKPNACPVCHRRDFLRRSLAGSALFFTAPGAFAEALSLTPRMTEGPFYPDHLPLDTDNDLVLVNDNLTPSVGEVTHLFGKVTDVQGDPIANARVEIWQVDHNAKYIHSRDGGLEGPGRDTNFQGFGRFMTSRNGEYYFRTIKPVPYPGRTPHIHVAVYQNNARMLTTQCFVKGEAQNETDGIVRRLGDQADLVVVDFKPVPESKSGELAAEFNIIIGATPEDAEAPRRR